MSTLDRNPYRGITPEELHVAIRRAHVERALAVRDMFQALRSWLGRIIHREHGAEPRLRTATCR
jgi:hypothetical protein